MRHRSSPLNSDQSTFRPRLLPTFTPPRFEGRYSTLALSSLKDFGTRNLIKLMNLIFSDIIAVISREQTPKINNIGSSGNLQTPRFAEVFEVFKHLGLMCHLTHTLLRKVLCSLLQMVL